MIGHQSSRDELLTANILLGARLYTEMTGKEDLCTLGISNGDFWMLKTGVYLSLFYSRSATPLSCGETFFPIGATAHRCFAKTAKQAVLRPYVKNGTYLRVRSCRYVRSDLSCHPRYRRTKETTNRKYTAMSILR